jgi:hypothetical protein
MILVGTDKVIILVSMQQKVCIVVNAHHTVQLCLCPEAAISKITAQKTQLDLRLS